MAEDTVAVSSEARRLTGVVPVLLTPMREDGSPDAVGMQRLVTFLLDAGVGGFWAMGSASEDINMSWPERVRAIRFAAEANAGRAPIVAGTGLTAVNDNLNFFDAIADCRLDGIHLLPYDLKLGDARYVASIHLLADRAPFPVWLYHNPKRGRAITASIIRELRDHPNVAGIKMGGYNLMEITRALALQTGDFQVIGAGGGQMFALLSLGASAHTTSDASCIPEPFVRLWKLFREGDFAGARRLQFDIIRFGEALPRTDNGEFAAEEKFILSLRGICSDYVNPAYRRLTEEEQLKVRSAADVLGMTWSPAPDTAASPS